MNERGATLVELMIAMVVFGITMTGTFNGLDFINQTNARAKTSVFAEQALNQAVHELLSLPGTSARLVDDGVPDDLFDTATPDYSTDAEGQPWTIDVDAKTFRLFYNLAEGSVPNTVDIRVFAAWNTDGGEPDMHHRAERLVSRGLF